MFWIFKSKKRRAPKCTKVVNHCEDCNNRIADRLESYCIGDCRLFRDSIGHFLSCLSVRTDAYKFECPHFEPKEEYEK